MTAPANPAPFRILLVEDDAVDAAAVRNALKPHGEGIHIDHVTDGGQALSFLRRQGHHGDAARPDLILLDLHLPGVGGAEVLDTIKGDPMIAHIPVVVVSSTKDAEEILDVYDGHANAFIEKNSDFHTFADAVRTTFRFWSTCALRP